MATYHFPLGGEHFLRERQRLEHLHQRRHVRLYETEAVVLAQLLHELGRSERRAAARHVVFPQGALEGFDDGQVLRFGPAVAGRLEVHAGADVEGAEPDGVDVADLGEDGVEVVDALDGFDLDHDGGLAVQVLVRGFLGVAGRRGEAGDEAEGRGGAGAAVLGAVLGGGDGVLRFRDGVHLWDDDRGAGVEGEADCGVVVTWDSDGLCQRHTIERKGPRTYRTKGMVRPSLMKMTSWTI